MAGYFHRKSSVPLSLGGWFVDGRWYANSAAKFWSGMLDELAAGYDEATQLELEASVAGTLTRQLLHPRASLQRMIDSQPTGELEAELARTAAALDLFGPPGDITYRIRAGGDATLEQDALPEIDADVFAHLVAWLPEWSGVDEAAWNGQDVCDTFTAERPEHAAEQRVTFTLNHSELHEGLYRCRVTVALEHARHQQTE